MSPRLASHKPNVDSFLGLEFEVGGEGSKGLYPEPFWFLPFYLTLLASRKSFSILGATVLFVYCLVAKPHLTFCEPMDCSPPRYSVHGISQARVVEWVAISFS